MKYRRIAWDGVSFRVPEEWELASYRWPEKGHTRIELEDDFRVCLTGEWQWAENTKAMKKFLKGLEKRNGELARKADHKVAVENVPARWSAFVYSFNRTVPNKEKTEIEVEKQQVFDATYTTRDFAASFQIRRTDGFPLELEDMGQTFVKDFELHTGDTVPWELFDINIDVPKAFKLQDTNFSIGSKYLTFEQKKRQLHIWILSCADVILKDADSLAHWCCGFLNSQGGIKNLVFKPTTAGNVVCRRRFPMIVTALREIERFCFKWKVKAVHQEEENRILIWVYNHRKKADMDWLPKWLE